jgi:hypothetical protein
MADAELIAHTQGVTVSSPHLRQQSIDCGCLTPCHCSGGVHPGTQEEDQA